MPTDIESPACGFTSADQDFRPGQQGPPAAQSNSDLNLLFLALRSEDCVGPMEAFALELLYDMTLLSNSDTLRAFLLWRACWLCLPYWVQIQHCCGNADLLGDVVRLLHVVLQRVEGAHEPSRPAMQALPSAAEETRWNFDHGPEGSITGILVGSRISLTHPRISTSISGRDPK